MLVRNRPRDAGGHIRPHLARAPLCRHRGRGRGGARCGARTALRRHARVSAGSGMVLPAFGSRAPLGIEWRCPSAHEPCGLLRALERSGWARHTPPTRRCSRTLAWTLCEWQASCRQAAAMQPLVCACVNQWPVSGQGHWLHSRPVPAVEHAAPA